MVIIVSILSVPRCVGSRSVGPKFRVKRVKDRDTGTSQHEFGRTRSTRCRNFVTVAAVVDHVNHTPDFPIKGSRESCLSQTVVSSRSTTIINSNSIESKEEHKQMEHVNYLMINVNHLDDNKRVKTSSSLVSSLSLPLEGL